MCHLSQVVLGHPRLFPTWCVGASSVPGLRCPICPRTTWDIQGCSQHGVWEHHQFQVRDVRSVPGQPGTSKVVPNMVCGSIISPRSEMSHLSQDNLGLPKLFMTWCVGASSVPGARCPICPRTTWDIQGCSRHGVWEHHQSQVQDVPSVPGQSGTSKVVPNMVCGSIISPRSKMSHLSQDNLGHPRLFPTWCVGASSVPGPRCPICLRLSWDIQGCSRHGVWEHHQSQVQDVPSVPGQPGTSKVVPNMVCGSIISPRSEMSHLSQVVLGHPRLFPTWCVGASSVPGPRCPICPRTTWDIRGCSQHGVWEHHQSQVRDVPSVPGQPGTSEVVPEMVCGSIISPRSEMSHLSQDNLGHPRLFPTWCVGASSVPGPRCPICPRTTWDIRGCSQDGVWEHHQSQVRDVPSVPGQPGTSKVVPDMVCGSIISPRSEMSHLSQVVLGHPRLFPTWCVGASSVPGPRCPICPRTTWDIQGCSQHGVWEHHQSQVRDVPSVSGCPGTSKVVPNMVCGSIISPRSKMSHLSQDNLGHPRLFPTWCVGASSVPGPRCPICPRTTWDIQGCSQHGVWEHHQSQVRDVPSVPGQPGTSKVVPNMVCGSIISPRSEMSHLSQDNLGHPRLFPTWCVGASSVPGPRCPICPRTTWDIRGCSQHGVWEHHQSQVQDVPSVPGQPGTSEVVPKMVCGSIISPRSEMSHLSQDNLGHPRLFPRWCVGASSVPGPRCPICPRTTWDIQGCSRHGVWEHHQSQVRDVPSVPGQPGGFQGCSRDGV